MEGSTFQENFINGRGVNKWAWVGFQKKRHNQVDGGGCILIKIVKQEGC